MATCLVSVILPTKSFLHAMSGPALDQCSPLHTAAGALDDSAGVSSVQNAIDDDVKVPEMLLGPSNTIFAQSGTKLAGIQKCRVCRVWSRARNPKVRTSTMTTDSHVMLSTSCVLMQDVYAPLPHGRCTLRMSSLRIPHYLVAKSERLATKIQEYILP